MNNENQEVTSFTRDQAIKMCGVLLIGYLLGRSHGNKVASRCYNDGVRDTFKWWSSITKNNI